MIQREKRNYVVVILFSCFMVFTTTFGVSGIIHSYTYGETTGTIQSVDVREVETGTYNDTSYHIESTVQYAYTVSKREYLRTAYLHEDYSGREGEQITVIYSRNNPGESNIGSRRLSLLSGITSLFGSAVLLCYIIYDTVIWIRRRKAENMLIAWQELSYNELLSLKEEQKKKEKSAVILLIASILCTFLLLFFAIPLLAFAITKIIDVRMCYPDQIK